MNQHQTQLFEIDGVKVPVETTEDEQNISPSREAIYAICVQLIYLLCILSKNKHLLTNGLLHGVTRVISPCFMEL